MYLHVNLCVYDKKANFKKLKEVSWARKGCIYFDQKWSKILILWNSFTIYHIIFLNIFCYLI